VLSLTILVPPGGASAALRVLAGLDGVRNLIHVPGAGVETGDDLVAAAVEATLADEVIERLEAAGVRSDRVTLSRSGVDVTEIGRDELEPDLWDEAADVVVWEEVVEDAAEDSRLSLT
jgi:hypothetical protein